MLRAGLVAVALIVGGSIAHAQAQRKTQRWYQAYEAGVRDAGRGAWDSAVQNLLAAKQTGPQPARRVAFYGDLVDVFNPDYYLGVAYLNLRRFGDADASFERVRQANLIPASDKLYAAFQTQASTARGEVALAQAEDYLTKGNGTLAAEAASRAATLGIARARVQDLEPRVAALRQLANAAGTTQQAASAPALTPPPVEQQLAPTPAMTGLFPPGCSRPRDSRASTITLNNSRVLGKNPRPVRQGTPVASQAAPRRRPRPRSPPGPRWRPPPRSMRSPRPPLRHPFLASFPSGGAPGS